MSKPIEDIISDLESLNLSAHADGFYTVREIATSSGLTVDTIRVKLRRAVDSPHLEVETKEISCMSISGKESRSVAYSIVVKKPTKRPSK